MKEHTRRKRLRPLQEGNKVCEQLSTIYYATSLSHMRQAAARSRARARVLLAKVRNVRHASLSVIDASNRAPICFATRVTLYMPVSHAALTIACRATSNYLAQLRSFFFRAHLSTKMLLRHNEESHVFFSLKATTDTSDFAYQWW